MRPGDSPGGRPGPGDCDASRRNPLRAPLLGTITEALEAGAGLARGYRNGTVSRDSGEAAVAPITALGGSLD